MIISRIAPTPSGYIHKGNAFNFLLTWLLVRKHGGTLHLRIDDIDQSRVREEYVEDIFNSLHWLGITWDKGPKDRQEFESAFSQMHRLAEYQLFLEELRTQGVLFSCSYSRKEILRTSPDGLYPDAFKQQTQSLDASEVAWRIHTPWPLSQSWKDLNKGQMNHVVDPGLKDAIVRKKDGMPSYQITSVVDDSRMGVNLIVRGEDLLGSSAFQQWLLKGYGERRDIRLYHHPLLLDSHKEKLSKSAGATALFQQYKSGKSPEALIQEFARWMGWDSFHGRSAQELLSFVMSHQLLPQLI